MPGLRATMGRSQRESRAVETKVTRSFVSCVIVTIPPVCLIVFPVSNGLLHEIQQSMTVLRQSWDVQRLYAALEERFGTDIVVRCFGKHITKVLGAKRQGGNLMFRVPIGFAMLLCILNHALRTET